MNAATTPRMVALVLVPLVLIAAGGTTQPDGSCSDGPRNECGNHSVAAPWDHEAVTTWLSVVLGAPAMADKFAGATLFMRLPPACPGCFPTCPSLAPNPDCPAAERVGGPLHRAIGNTLLRSIERAMNGEEELASGTEADIRRRLASAANVQQHHVEEVGLHASSASSPSGRHVSAHC